MIFFPDVNVLIALAWPNHLHHSDAHRWFSDTINGTENSWATSPLTQTAFIRISSNPRIIHDAVPVREAQTILDAYIQHPAHVFWADTLDASVLAKLPPSMLQGHRQVTDAYLLSLAFQNSGVLVTFDKAIVNQAVGTKYTSSVQLLQNS